MISKSIQDTEKLAGAFIDKVLKKKAKGKGAIVVCLSGELGAGKTAFTKAVSKHLGIKEVVNSPTFVIMKKYLLPQPRGSAQNLFWARGSNFRFLFHFDAYRLDNEEELLYLKWEEIIRNKDNLVIIEWPEKVKNIIPSFASHIKISNDENGKRVFKFS